MSTQDLWNGKWNERDTNFLLAVVFSQDDLHLFLRDLETRSRLPANCADDARPLLIRQHRLAP